MLEGLRGPGNKGAMAFDDLSVVRGECDVPGTCDFENGFCGWVDEGDTISSIYTDMNWNWYKAEYSPSGLLTDHTTFSGQGMILLYDLYNDNCTPFSVIVSSTVQYSEVTKEACYVVATHDVCVCVFRPEFIYISVATFTCNWYLENHHNVENREDYKSTLHVK